MRISIATPLVLLALALVAASPGCRAPSPAEFQVESTWRVRTGQAVWKPRAKADEITGDLTVATGAPGEFLVEFSKPALPLIRVSRKGSSWQIAAPRRGTHSGRGAGPHLAWMEAGQLFSGANLRPPWRGEIHAEGWWVEHPRTGERLEGFLSP